MARKALDFTSASNSNSSKPIPADDTPPKPKKQCLSHGEFDISKVQDPTPHATVHGMLASLSPLKPSKYFEAELTDGNQCIRMVGLDKSQQVKLQPFFDKGLPVKLQNCQIKKNRFDQLEVIVRNSTQIELSPTKYNIKDLETIGSKEITLEDLDSCSEYEKVTVKVKVNHLDTPVIVSGGKRKQNVIIADTTGSATLTLWESDIGKLQEDESYHLIKLIVRIYQDQHYLSFPMSGATIHHIDDLQNVIEADTQQPMDETLHGVQVIGVPSLEAYLLCLKCKGKVQLHDDDEELGTCTKCNMTQLIASCTTQLTAKLFVQCGLTYYTFQAFGEMLRQITNNDEVQLKTSSKHHSLQCATTATLS